MEKSVLDWVGIFGTPVVAAVIAGAFAIWAQRSGRRAEVERNLASERARESALRVYLDRITDLVIEKKMHESEPGSPERAVAYAQTLSVLRGMDSARKGILVRFLSLLNLLTEPEIIISLRSADLSGANLAETSLATADLHSADLTGAHLAQAELSRADLSGAILINTDLSKAVLRGANLSAARLQYGMLNDADLSEADLTNASLHHADVRDACLNNANMKGANLFRAKLTGAALKTSNLTESNLHKARLDGANLTGADLSGARLNHAALYWWVFKRFAFAGLPLVRPERVRADLSEADLSNANLYGAVVAKEQLRQARNLLGATMPNGTLMTEERWDEFRGRSTSRWWRSWRRFS